MNRRTGHLLDGHLRLRLALGRGEPTVPVLEVDLEPDEERLVLATLDPIGAMAEADGERLDELLASLMVDDAALAGLLDELKAAVGSRPGRTDPDAVPTLPGAAELYVRPGDLWLLGERHRLLVGDATDPAVIERLLEGARPAVTIADPPYGVRYDPTWRPGHRRSGAVPGDERADWRAVWALSPSDVLYVWHGGLHAGVVAAGIEAAGFLIRAQIIWAKPSPVLSRGAYHWQHEPLYYAVRRGRPALWRGGRGQTTVWPIAPVHGPGSGSADERTIHGAQKPVEAIERALRNHRGDLFDPFAGSGTGLIAAERLCRRSFSVELDPLYAQVALERWQAYTGREAVRDER